MKSLTSGLLTLMLAVGLSTSTLAADRGPSVVAKQGGNQVSLFLGPCTTKKGVFETAPADLVAEFKEARILWDGKEYDACWKHLDSESIYLVDETGDAGALPISLFKKPDVI